MNASPWQAFLAESNFSGQGQKPTLEWIASKLLHSGRLWPCFVAFDSAGKTCQGQTV
jgi:hypothetical protein